MTSELHDLVRRLGLAGSVTFLGQRQDVPELLCGADVFVFPSRWEGLGSVLLEAMALEIPVVAADIPPVREVLGNDGELAALVPPGNVEELATSVVDALSDRKEARERTARARRRFLDRFTIDQVADQMVAFYRRSLAG
jgi:glycosyltransferase involved in cell wall biosynthesis